AGVTLTLNGAAVNGGFLRGTGVFALTGNASLSGATTLTTTTVNQTGPATLTNFSNGGTLTNQSGQTLTLDGGVNASSGLLTVNGTTNVGNFVSNGRLAVNPGGTLNSNLGGLVLGGGSVTNIGIYNPN